MVFSKDCIKQGDSAFRIQENATGLSLGCMGLFKVDFQLDLTGLASSKDVYFLGNLGL